MKTNNSDVYFYHSSYSGKNNTPRVTLACTVEENTLLIAAARCSRNDQFSKAKGRIIANGRLRNRKLAYTAPLYKGETPKYVFYALAEKIAQRVLHNTALINSCEELVRPASNIPPTTPTTNGRLRVKSIPRSFVPKRKHKGRNSAPLKYKALYDTIESHLLPQTNGLTELVVSGVKPSALRKSISKRYGKEVVRTRKVDNETLRIFQAS